VGDSHQVVVLAFAGFSQQIMRYGISFFDGDGFVGCLFHSLIIFLNEAYIRQCQESIGNMRFHYSHFLQKFAGLCRFSQLDVELAEISQCLEILLNGKGFRETFYGIIRASHALRAQTVIFEDLESFPVVFLLFTFRCLRFPGEERFKKVRHDMLFLSYTCKCNNLF
jgi:hypothetical protein